MRKLSEKHIGMVDLPLLSVPSLKQQMVGHRSANTTLEQLEALSAEQKGKMVLVVQDPFTSYYDAQVVADFVRLVEKVGYQPVLLPFSPNGKAQHIKGFLTRFARTAQKTADFLNRVAELGMPMVGSIRRWCFATAMNITRSSARSAAISASCWCTSGCRRCCRKPQLKIKAANRGICLATVPR